MVNVYPSIDSEKEQTDFQLTQESETVEDLAQLESEILPEINSPSQVEQTSTVAELYERRN